MQISRRFEGFQASLDAGKQTQIWPAIAMKQAGVVMRGFAGSPTPLIQAGTRPVPQVPSQVITTSARSNPIDFAI